MVNLDDTVLGIQEQIRAAMQSDNEEGMIQAFSAMARSIENNILKEARDAFQLELSDRATLEARGQAQLTSEERKYYDKVIEKRSFEGVEDVMPKTIFERVFEDLQREHPLLSKIDFHNATGSMEWILRTEECVGAFWGKLTAAITKELENGFTKENMGLAKLTAFIPVSKAMLDLGPVWLDRFVRAMLAESVSIALEEGIIAGTGKDQPIGMLKDLEGSVTLGVYPDKEATPLTDFSPATLGKSVVAPLTREGKRNVTEVLMIVNPLDYWEKIFGATTILTANGTYVYGVIPIPGEIITSAAVPKGKMVAGIAKDYFMGIGSERKIEYSDHVKFLDDERIYITKQYANGKPKDNKSFLVFDITNLEASLNVGLKAEGVAAATYSQEDLVQAVSQGIALALSQASPEVASVEGKAKDKPKK